MRRLLAATLFLLTVALSGAAQTPSSAPPLSKKTRIDLIRSLNAETVFVRRPLPSGVAGVEVKNGTILPEGQAMDMLIAKYGAIAKIGDRARITNVEFKKDRIIFELNGGPVKKKAWYERIQVSGMGGSAPVAPDKDDPNATGTSIALVFDKYVPELTGDQVREMLSPILDFKAKSAGEAFLDTVPPNVREAIKAKRVLVGMNREMVQYAKGRPERKIRESEDGKPFEEWIYGTPPQEVEFIRFSGDEVVRVTAMKVDGEKVVRTEREVQVDSETGVTKQAEQKKSPRKVPSLKRPGETDPDVPLNQPPFPLPAPDSGQVEPPSAP